MSIVIFNFFYQIVESNIKKNLDSFDESKIIAKKKNIIRV